MDSVTVEELKKLKSKYEAGAASLSQQITKLTNDRLATFGAIQALDTAIRSAVSPNPESAPAPKKESRK